MKYAHIIAEFYSRVWALRPEKLHAINELIRMRADGQKFTAEELRERIGAGPTSPRPRASTPGTLAMIPVLGVISHRMNLMADISGGTSIEQLTAQIRAALADPAVKAIVLDVDSPGGSVDGVAELASEIFEARGQKKIIAIANGMAASAAYWLASAADEFVVTPTGAVGSIGVFAAHQDLSKALEAEGVKISLISAGKYKTEGNPYEPLSDEARAEMQSKVDAFYGMFSKAVARYRGATPADVRSGFGQGRMVMAADAVRENMADRVATLDDVLAKYGASTTSGTSRRISASSSSPKASDATDEGGAECVCACSACKACDLKDGAQSSPPAPTPIDDGDEDDPQQCRCECSACKTCEMKMSRPQSAAEVPAIARRRRELSLYS